MQQKNPSHRTVSPALMLSHLPCDSRNKRIAASRVCLVPYSLNKCTTTNHAFGAILAEQTYHNKPRLLGSILPEQTHRDRSRLLDAMLDLFVPRRAPSLLASFMATDQHLQGPHTFVSFLHSSSPRFLSERDCVSEKIESMVVLLRIPRRRPWVPYLSLRTFSFFDSRSKSLRIIPNRIKLK